MKASTKPIEAGAAPMVAVVSTAFALDSVTMLQQLLNKKGQLALTLPHFLRSAGDTVQVNNRPNTVEDSGNNNAPTPINARTENGSRGNGCSDVTHILVASPQTENQATTLSGEPIAHNSSINLITQSEMNWKWAIDTYRSTSGLKSTMDQLTGQKVGTAQCNTVNDTGRGTIYNSQ